MSATDDRILEYLETEGRASPAILLDDGRIEGSRQHLNTRLRILKETPLVAQVGPGMYEITDTGKAYLTGDFDARDLDDPTADD